MKKILEGIKVTGINFWKEEEGIGVVELVLILVNNYVSLFNYIYCLLCYYIYEIKKSIYISYPIHPINQSVLISISV